MHESGEMWASIGHPVNPDKLVLAVGTQGSTFNDHGMFISSALNATETLNYAPSFRIFFCQFVQKVPPLEGSSAQRAVKRTWHHARILRMSFAIYPIR